MTFATFSYHLNRKISKRPYASKIKDGTIEALNNEWPNLNMKNMGQWCGKLCDRVRINEAITNFMARIALQLSK